MSKSWEGFSYDEVGRMDESWKDGGLPTAGECFLNAHSSRLKSATLPSDEIKVLKMLHASRDMQASSMISSKSSTLIHHRLILTV